MPHRQTPLISGNFYHIFNRGINRQPVFNTKSEYLRAIFTLKYYQFSSPIKLSYLLTKSNTSRQELLKSLSVSFSKVDVLAFSLMPNHFHLVIRQNQVGGISKYLADFQNSYTKYFNAKNKRSGSLFNRQFKSVHIETEGHLSHLIRYVVLNPYSSSIVKNPNDIIKFPYNHINYELINKFTKMSPSKFKEFVLDHADYQKKLANIKHLTFE